MDYFINGFIRQNAVLPRAQERKSNWSLGRPNIKIILMWGLRSGLIGNEPLIKAECPITSCVFTPDESMINKSDVVVFYVETLMDFPTNRHPHQRFVFAQLESPMNSNILKISDHRLRYGYFNWTMTYRWDSDIVHRGDYGFMVKKLSNNIHRPYGMRSMQINRWISKTFWRENQFQLLSSVENNPIENTIKGKTKMIAWFVSHCSTPIRREEYVRKLRQYVSIDIFGSCNNNKCVSNCDNMLRSDYKFYLSFENSWCPDYVTEKFYRPMMFDTVPIVMGGANYSKFAPPNSFINARDFNSPRELADYILLLNSTDTMYAKYFEWKTDYEIILSDNSGLCDLCRMAHDKTLPSKTYNDIQHWWINELKCENNSRNFFWLGQNKSYKVLQSLIITS